MSKFRFQVLTRESAAYVILRRKGYTVSAIAKAFGRSTSVVHRRIKTNEALNVIRKFDLRKIPNRIRRLQKSRHVQVLRRYISGLEAWILGEGEKPP